ncbi:MAG: methyltransferase domain-containing protein [Magnetococcales bacterium]|nr:methyltransferase domain-containing protein [Magnetococcales bacterium]
MASNQGSLNHVDAVRLQSWYATPQGRTTAEVIGQALTPWLEGAPVVRTLGFGFPQPYMDLMGGWSGQLLGAAPAEMGVARWPSEGLNRFALVRPDALPFDSCLFDRVLMIHLLERVEALKATLRESWRVLKPGGRLMVVVPNRGGWWARRDSTPFGWGRSFSPWQLREMLQDSFFIPRQSRYALFTPPFTGRWLWESSAAWEKAGDRWFPLVGGVILCDAEKVVCATIPAASGVMAWSRAWG